jgi:hypothetical protein
VAISSFDFILFCFYWFLVQWAATQQIPSQSCGSSKPLFHACYPLACRSNWKNEALPQADLQRKTFARAGKLGMKTLSYFCDLDEPFRISRFAQIKQFTTLATDFNHNRIGFDFDTG